MSQSSPIRHDFHGEIPTVEPSFVRCQEDPLRTTFWATWSRKSLMHSCLPELCVEALQNPLHDGSVFFLIGNQAQFRSNQTTIGSFSFPISQLACLGSTRIAGLSLDSPVRNKSTTLFSDTQQHGSIQVGSTLDSGADCVHQC